MQEKILNLRIQMKSNANPQIKLQIVNKGRNSYKWFMTSLIHGCNVVQMGSPLTANIGNKTEVFVQYFCKNKCKPESMCWYKSYVDLEDSWWLSS